ncbi:MAG: hypothetical protein RJA33_23 [Actinomycetota bacterium]|jgi:hypothetical protein
MRLLSFKKRLGRLLGSIEARGDQNSYFHEFHVSQQWGLWPDRNRNPLTTSPQRFWSQADEDGIVNKILARIPAHERCFVEFGCGDGLQNNSLNLLAQGWSGGWIDGSPLPYELPKGNSRVKFQNSWVTKENIVNLFENALPDSMSRKSHVGLLSMDLDGNDYHFLQEILGNGKSADVIVLEYNARFPVGANWIMPYNSEHSWLGDDYFGASLSSFTELLRSHGYKLVACSVQGSNAFYVHKNHLVQFEDITQSEDEIYQPPLYYLIHQWAQKASGKTVLALLEQLK